MTLQRTLEGMSWRDRFNYLQKHAGWVAVPCRLKWNELSQDKELFLPKQWNTIKTLTEIEPHIKYSNNACMLLTGQDVGICGVDVDDLEKLNLLWRHLHPGKPLPEDQDYFNTFTVRSGGKNCFVLLEKLQQSLRNFSYIV